jgi:thiamine-phosphate pyrophosphorylase
MTDRDLLSLAKRVRGWTREAGALFIMNDRPDLALLAGADGVHVGQDELSVSDARKIVGPDRLVGVSTHSIEQARRAVLDGADYLGVGPTYPSGTKNFTTDEIAGLRFVQEVAAEITLPWFAIGGISAENIEQITATGAQRIAVSGCVCNTQDVRQAARQLRNHLDQIAT